MSDPLADLANLRRRDPLADLRDLRSDPLADLEKLRLPEKQSLASRAMGAVKEGFQEQIAGGTDLVSHAITGVPQGAAFVQDVASFMPRLAANAAGTLLGGGSMAEAQAAGMETEFSTPLSNLTNRASRDFQNKARDLTGTSRTISPVGEFIGQTVGDIIGPAEIAGVAKAAKARGLVTALTPNSPATTPTKVAAAVQELAKGVRVEDVVPNGFSVPEVPAVPRRDLRTVWDEYEEARRALFDNDASKPLDEAKELLSRVRTRDEMRSGTESGSFTLMSQEKQQRILDAANKKYQQAIKPIRDRVKALEAELDEVAAAENAAPKQSPVKAEPEVSADSPEVPLKAALTSNSPTTPSAKVAAAGGEYVAPTDKLTKAREYISDDMIRVKQLVDDPNNKVTEASNIYDAEIRSHGRAASRTEEAHTQVQKLDQDIITTAKRHGIADKQLSEEVNQFLIARHAPERNRIHGDGAAGITDADAAQFIKDIGAKPYAAEVKRIGDELQELDNKTLDVLLESEVISLKDHTKIRKAYKNHIPLNRIMDNDEDIGATLSMARRDVRSTGILKAKGSDREVSDVVANIVTNYDQAIIRSERNRVDLSIRQFAIDNPHLELFTEVKPKAVGFQFDGVTPILEKIDDPQVLTMRVKGEPFHLRINDPHMAVALRGMGGVPVDGILRVAGWYTRRAAMLATRFNVEFPLANKIRDLQEAVVYALSRGELGVKGARGVVAKDASSMRAVMDSIRGVDTPDVRLYHQMQKDGGTTGGMALSSRKKVTLDIEAIRKTNRSAPRKAAQEILGAIDNWNTIFEDSTRFSVYKSALANGSSREKAAVLAKDATINFNKFGRGGPQLNALYMFANASIQGTEKMVRAMKNPRVAGVVTTSIFTSVGAINAWNDKMDPHWRDRISKYDRLSSLPIVTSFGGKFSYVTIPVAISLKPIKIAADYTFDAVAGHMKSPAEMLSGIVAATAESANPLGGTDLVSAALPTPLDLPAELGRNTAWHGGKIKPDWNKDRPASQRYFRSLGESASGRTTIAVSNAMSGVGIEISPADIKYAYESLVGGAGRAVSKAVNTGIAAAKGEAPEMGDVPFVSRFVKRPDDDEIRQRDLAARKKKNKLRNP